MWARATPLAAQLRVAAKPWALLQPLRPAAGRGAPVLQHSRLLAVPSNSAASAGNGLPTDTLGIDPDRKVIAALVQNEQGVLARVVTLFSGRGFNIDSLVVGRTEVPELSRMTVVVNCDDAMVSQVTSAPVPRARKFAAHRAA